MQVEIQEFKMAQVRAPETGKASAKDLTGSRAKPLTDTAADF